MKISSPFSSSARVVATTLFFSGIVISAGMFYALPGTMSEEGFYKACGIMGLTFLSGLLAIHLTARSIRQSIVYLAPKKENAQKVETTDADSQLNMEVINKLVGASDGAVAQKVITELCQQLQAGQGAIYVTSGGQLALKYGFALPYEKDRVKTFEFGEGLIGRVAAESNILYIDKLPENYITVFSGLGSSSPTHLVIVPIKRSNEVVGAIELATFSPVNKSTLRHLEDTGRSLATTTL